MANVRSTQDPRRVVRSVFIPLVAVAGVLAALVLGLILSGRQSGLAPTLLPLIALAGTALLGLLLFQMRKVQMAVALPVERLQSALSRVPEEGLAAITGLRDPGVLSGVVREASALLERYVRDDDEEPGAREAILRGRLETVLRDLHDGVMICTLDHQVLLYNRRALDILHVTGTVGLDRPLFETLAARPFRHALSRLLARHSAGRHIGHADGLSVMVIGGTVDGRYTIKGRMSLMLDDAGERPVGYVVTFQDVTNDLSASLWRERALFDIRTDLKARLDSLAAKMQSHDLAEDIEAVAAEIDRFEALTLDVMAGAWPMSAVFSATLFDCVGERNSEERNLTFSVEGDPVWLHCDSATITDLIDRLANRLAVDQGVGAFRMIATLASEEEAFIDLLYEGDAVDDDTMKVWLDEPLEPDLGSLTGSDVLHRHRCDLVIDALDASTARVRFPLKTAAERYARTEKSLSPAEPRREFYDFDLLHRPHAHVLDERPLSALTCVVFDTETTGLEPSKGDEMISIGAVRIVNGRLLRGEIFNEFINPGRPIPAASTNIHGITDAMVADAPTAIETLPRFHGFAGPGALIAHNAAFDMKFLSLKEKAAGVRFNQPVLDTLLLAAHVFGRDETLSLDGLSDRFGVELAAEDRHTALGDAVATAEVFLRLLPILEARGVRTLGEAQAASDRQVGLRRMQAQF